MRKLLISMFTALVLAGGAAFAQDVVVVDDDQYWAGISAGYPGAQLHFGIDGLAPNLGLRFNAGYVFSGDFGLGADALYDLDVDTDGAPIDVYVGGGIGAEFEGGFLVRAFAGGEFFLADAGVPDLGIFAEVGPAIQFGGGFRLHGSLGVNYHF